ncbi:glycosyltransferase family 2 protein [Paracoccus aestuariivivens]|uniref:Glycosyltransferase n=1 Tax=Paracoccus aestuariivivens TaxID=1820333 RepID=A0A6L6JDP5_9RHOB|nr:glycosyltransferase family 2 protein [Paracoccus aestuariivivens]MTH80283.1 glycosyltransferase [Paracoccus aestuariivivens]
MPEVMILMATHNGGRFLAEQLHSISCQSHTDWHLIISDDSSTDKTKEIIGKFSHRNGQNRVTLLDGPEQGATENFRSLIRRAELQGRYLAFSDQDDVWDEDHLARGLEVLMGLAKPLAIYGCRMRICDADLNQIGMSPWPTRPLGFKNALVQNVLSGNTMIMTPQAAQVLQSAEREVGPVPIHDWWAYQMITGAGGVAHLDKLPHIHYRQHGANVIGANRGIRTLPDRLGRHLRGGHRAWALQNSAALMATKSHLTAENITVLQLFTEALSAPLTGKIIGLRRSGIYYQSPQARAGFWLSVALGGF